MSHALAAMLGLAGCADTASLTVTVGHWQASCPATQAANGTGSTGPCGEDGAMRPPQAIAGATVDVQQRAATTDAEGVARFTGLQVRYSDVFVDFAWEGQPAHVEGGLVLRPGENRLDLTWPDEGGRSDLGPQTRHGF